MVTKFEGNLAASVSRSVLAKIHMVTKLPAYKIFT